MSLPGLRAGRGDRFNKRNPVECVEEFHFRQKATGKGILGAVFLFPWGVSSGSSVACHGRYLSFRCGTRDHMHNYRLPGKRSTGKK